MVIQKVFILIILLFYSLFEPQVKRNISDQGGVLFSTDSLKNEILSSGWNNNTLKLLDLELENSDRTDLQELIKGFPEGWEKTYLNAILLKREGKFPEMYDSLFSVLEKYPLYSPYYFQLVFSATAENRINFIEEAVSSEGMPPAIKDLLSSLILKSQSRFNDALEPALNVYEADSENFNLIYNVYDIYRNLGDYENGMLYVSRMFDLVEKIPSHLAEAHYAAGTLLFLSGKYKDAEKSYRKGFEISSLNNLNLNIAKGNINLGIIEDLKGNTDKARDYFKNAARIAGIIQSIPTEAHALSELGVSYSFTNELIEAKRNYLESYHRFKKTGNRSRLAYLSENLGKIYLQMFDYRSALKYYEEGIQYAGDNKRAQILNLTGIADVYANLSNYTKALLYYKEAEKISSEIKEAALSAEINIGLGMLNYNLNMNSNALRYFHSAEEFSGSAEDPFLTARVYREMGLVYTDFDSLAEAQKLLTKALEISSRIDDSYMEALTLLDLGRIYSLKKEYGSALVSAEKALGIASANNFEYLGASGELLKGEIFRGQNNFNKSKEAFQKCAVTAKDLREPNLRISAIHSLAELFRDNGFDEAASSYYVSAMRIIDEVSSSLFSDEDIQISYFSGKRSLYDSYADFLINKGYYANAFEIIDKSRSRSTIQHLNNLKLQEYVKDEQLLNTIYEYDWIVSSGIYNKDKTDSVNQLYSKLKKELLLKNASLARYLDKEKTLEVREIQERLNGDENLISLYTSSEGIYLFIISKDSFTNNFVKIKKTEIAEMISSVSPYFNHTGQPTYFNQHLFSFNAKAGYELYEKIFKETLNNIPEGKKIIFSPSSEFASFPFEFLIKTYREDDSPYNYKNKDYLVAHYNISYTPSVNTYIEQKENKLKNNARVLVVGNPSINKQLQGYSERRGLLEETGGVPRNIVLLPLKYSAEEVNEVSGLLNADKILLSTSATETNFKNNASYSRVIHLSTHSFLHNKQPVIFFSNSYDPENDGFLESGEIVQMQLNSDLVVLSSCNSGLGKLDESEGILGMAKAFFETGTKSIIVSLWEVNDKYTAVLMTLFYQKIKEGYDKSEALRLAKLDFIRDYSPNPYYWSAFVLNGDTSELEIKSNTQIQFYIAGLFFILLLALIIVVVLKKNKTEVLQQT